MTKKDSGAYRAKHPAGDTPDQRIAEAVKQKMQRGEISCAAASRISDDLPAAMKDVGLTIDLLELHLTQCQLGLFGYAPERKIVAAAQAVVPALEKAIRENLSGGRLPCKAAWEIAQRLRVPRMEVASACEHLQIKVKPCQLGAF